MSSIPQKSARNRDVEQVEMWAAEQFKDHVITVKHQDGVYRHFACHHRDGGSNRAFSVVTYPGHLIVSGDNGDLMLARSHDMFFWAPNAIRSIDYFAEKVVAGKVHEYSGDVAKEMVEEARTEAANSEDGDMEPFEDFDDHDYSDEWSTLQMMHGSCIWEYGDFPDTNTFTNQFLWCRESLKWFFANWKDEPKSEVQHGE